MEAIIKHNPQSIRFVDAQHIHKNRWLCIYKLYKETEIMAKQLPSYYFYIVLAVVTEQ